MSAGPLTAVMTAVDDGALTSAEIARATGLSMDLIRAALMQLQRMGYLTAEQLATSCSAGGCGDCASASSASGTCSTGPVLIGLSSTRRR